MAADINLTWTDRQHPAEENCPVRFKYQKIDGQTLRQTGCSPVTQDSSVSVGGVIMVDDMVAMETKDSSEDELGRLDVDLDRKSKQHNLTTSNVRTILHEVITHEHVVAMMKAAIRDTQDLPMFEPKMTRSRLKQAVQQGQPINWSLSAVNTVKPPQFVDIDLEDDEDSSDEEYCPDEEEEEEDTAEETFLSDADSLASPLRIHHNSRSRLPADQWTDGPLQRPPGPLSEHVMTAPSADSSFLERLNAVEEELDYSPTYTFDQSLDRKPAADNDVDEEGCLAYRTRSKLRLVNVPLGQLEAELLAPDITADMYDLTAKKWEEDRHWVKWLQGLMAPDNEEEAEDDDDPEYNFLDDMDEPDVEDYRTDRAVQITKREVNELLEELFVTLQEEDEVEQEEGREEEEEREEDWAPSQTGPKFNVPQALCFAAPLASMLTERRQTVRKQYEALQQRRALQDSTNQHRDDINRNTTTSTHSNSTTPVLVLPCHMGHAFHLDLKQKLQLQQQIQQHVQLLIQVHLLSRRVDALNHEACITKHYLEELQQFSSRQEQMFQRSSFRVCNLQGALDLLQEVTQREEPRPAPPAPAATRRLLPQMTPATNSHAFPLLPADLAWLFATRPVFLYPELLPVCSLDPTLHSQNPRSIYTAGEDGLIVLGQKHFEGAVQSDQLISSYLLCKNRWNIKKHIREMSSPRAAPNNVIKMFLTQRVVPHLPLACSRVQPGDQRPAVEKNVLNMPNWLKNSQQIIQKTQLDSKCYPPTLPLGCTLRLHPYWLNKTSRPPPPHHRRLFTLAHNASLLPLAKAPDDRQVDKPANGQADMQPITCLSLPPPSVPLRSDSPTAHAVLPLAPPPAVRAVALAAAHPVPAQSVCNDMTWRCPRFSPHTQQNTPLPVVLPFASPFPSPSAAVMQPGFFLLQMNLPADISQHAPRNPLYGPIREAQEEVRLQEERQVKEESAAPMLSPPLKQRGRGWVGPGGEEQVNQEKVDQTNMCLLSLNGGETTGGDDDDGRKGGGAEGDGRGEAGGGQDEDKGREAGQRGEEEGQRQEGGGEKEEDGEKDKDEDQDRPGEEEDEEDFDDLTQDEDEEEVMSSASEESVLSVPELQETMKQLTWLAAERRLCADADSEEDHSPTSPGSQEEEEEEEEEGPKGEESEEGRSSKTGGDDQTPSGEGAPRGVGQCPGRGRGRSRPLRGLRRSRQERRSKDATKLLLLFDENLLDNDPHRESKDVAFAQSYLSRVREALQDVPGQVEQFVSLLNEFEQVGEGQEVVSLFRKLRCILGDRADLLRDFAAFLHPEQALQCGLWEEQQAFERSRRFLRQLEISFGDNPSHYQKIIKALQTGPDLSPACIHELKGQMATLLKGHTHLQTEFWVFFDELRPPPARPGQFEEAQWPEEGGCMLDSGDSIGQLAGGGASGGFEEVTLPELEEEDEGHKIQPMTSRRQRRKLNVHINYKDCDWLDKEWPCLCRDVKIRRHKRKGCSRCHANKTSGGVSRAIKSLDPLYSQISSTSCEQVDKYLDLKGDDDSPQPDRSAASWEGSFRLTDDKEEEEELDDDEDDEEEEERRNIDKEQSPAVKRSRREEALQPCVPLPSTWTPSSSAPCHSSNSPSTSSSVPCSTSTSLSCVTSSLPTSTSVTCCSSSSAPPRSSLPLDLPVCAKNISLTASGEKVILWTREADRVILTTCQQEGANQGTFQSISTLLGNKTPAEVSRRFRDLMRLFRTAARQTSSEDEAPPAEQTAADEEED
ncbi:GON-4-like protein isoform X2 [Echeneis naucrates]|uniref:GON-4-like protein isoform X2 n=1 Tax=Echeneis naucrates TaxID=173247 RepID=UPI0011146A69|nr:GON-4-like protein isoform X2 [Echeneis naucrates]